ncbi:hypothetical protein ACJX0J_001909 (mitochondrion) [Zea mays]
MVISRALKKVSMQSISPIDEKTARLTRCAISNKYKIIMGLLDQHLDKKHSLMLYKITICISQRFWTLGDEITDMLSIIPNIGRIIMKCPDLIARHPFHAYQIIIK